jgi:hypothetical protein
MVESVEPPHTQKKKDKYSCLFLVSSLPYHYKLDFFVRMLINLILFQCLCRLIKEKDKERDKIFISGMITHESDKESIL